MLTLVGSLPPGGDLSGAGRSGLTGSPRGSLPPGPLAGRLAVPPCLAGLDAGEPIKILIPRLLP